ncbi:MAG: FAD-dependent oxidoreductase, partial [Prevotellaceae bacterium]|nr:FAD-dependent oxidoreductase [Prevotellaceae bacterium]
KIFGSEGSAWLWQEAQVDIKGRKTQLALSDLTGFNGRCDAIYFTQDAAFAPPVDEAAMIDFRRRQTKIVAKSAGAFDLVVVGGGVAGMCAAISAARLGLRVALVHDRPVWGGNNSSEVRVHLGGRMALAPYPELGGVVKELSPAKGGNAKPADRYEDSKKAELMSGEANITAFMSYHVFAVEAKDGKIISVTARHIETGAELTFAAPLFADCTGDGAVGALAGADYAVGREARDEFGEPTAPETSDKLVMGSSVQWYAAKQAQPTDFPAFSYGLTFNEASAQKVKAGEWTWETGMNLDQVRDFERIRDYGLMVVYSNWSFLKNESHERETYAQLALEWVAYVAGKRESRRLLGDIILKEQDILDTVSYPDGTASTSWSVDLHYPDPKNGKHFPGQEFKSVAVQTPIYAYPIPYRCLYSRNLSNLFMAGRNISVTHVALGTVRVMRTTGMMGEVVGMAASLCKQHSATPRELYEKHLNELQALMRQGVGKAGAAGYPAYNLGRSKSFPAPVK